MRKTLYYFGAVTISLMLQSLIGCSEKETPVNPPPCDSCPCTICPAAPTITVSITTPNPAWYNDSATVTYSTTGSDTVTINNVPASTLSGTITFTNLKMDSVVVFLAKGPGGMVTKTITLNVHSEKRTLLCNYGPVHQTYYKVCNVDLVNNPLAWSEVPVDCNTFQFFAADSAQMTIGSCNPLPGTVWKVLWTFQDNETKIFFSDFDLWNLDSLDVHGFQKSQIKADPFNPSISYITVQKFRH